MFLNIKINDSVFTDHFKKKTYHLNGIVPFELTKGVGL